MPKVKLPRKSTNIDMTAMCDVAFLLLSFFILTTKFKAPEALAVVTPNSVSAKIAPQKDVVLVTIDKGGKVYFSVSDVNSGEKKTILETVNSSRNLGLTPTEIAAFSKNPTAYIGVPFSQLKSYLSKTADEMKNALRDMYYRQKASPPGGFYPWETGAFGSPPRGEPSGGKPGRR